jgi:hypothetical protein
VAEPIVCHECRTGVHVRCIDRDDRLCTCTCAGYTSCDTCGGLVVLVADDADDSSYAHGECCTWAYVDTFEGTIRLDLRPVDG